MVRSRFALMSVFLWLNLILFGALAFETSILYPNQFHDVPRSLTLSDEFMTEAGTGDFLRPAGMATVIVGVLTLIAMWRWRRVRGWVAASLLVLVAANFVFSVLYFWPANTIMFTEGTALHAPEELRAVAAGFVGWNVVRIIGCATAAVCAFGAFVRFQRDAARYRIEPAGTPVRSAAP